MSTPIVGVESLQVRVGEHALVRGFDALVKATDPIRVALSEAGSRTVRLYRPLSLRVDAWLAGVWTSLATDLFGGEALTLRYGIAGIGPLDNVAGSGACTFSLLNTAAGKYSPSSASVLAGWMIGTPVRVVFQLAGGGDRVKFVGKVADVDPDAGLYGPRRVHVTAYDYVKDLADAQLREIHARINDTDPGLLAVVLDALPTASRPPAVHLDAPLDTYPVAFDQVASGDSGMGLIQDVMTSAHGIYFQRGDGVHVYANRQTRTFTASKDAFTATDLVDGAAGLSAPAGLGGLYNDVIVEKPNIAIGDTVEVLAAETGTDTTGIAAGATVELWIDYHDPLFTATTPVAVGGTGFVDPPVSGTDYAFNSASDGSGSNVTASMTVTAEFFVGTVKYTITNTTAAVAYRRTLQARGNAIRRAKPTNVESMSTQPYGVKTLRVRTPFQTSLTIAQFIADYLRGQYEVATQRPAELRIRPDLSERLAQHAVEREPGDRITVTEAVTGIAADAIIHEVELSARPTRAGLWLDCRWTLAPQSSFMFITPWALGTVGQSEIGNTTVLA